MRGFRRIAVVAVAAASLSPAGALARGPGKRLVDLRQTTLANGLRVVTVEDHTAPVIAIDVTYDVGSRDERDGRTGFAHLFEHMMFKGSENVGPGEHFTQVFTSGGDMNGTTNPDRTLYYDVLPSNQLDLALFLEADRMRSLAITKENLDNQRNAVQEERRQFVDNQPYGATDEKQQELLYDAFPYKHVTIGSMKDLDAASVEDVAQFFKTYYAPNNATLVLVGDFDTNDALARIRSRFEAIPRQPDPPSVELVEPTQTAERRATLEDPLARLARVDVAFKGAPGNTDDFYALSVASDLLTSGKSSRVYQALVKRDEIAANVYGQMDERRGPGGLYVTALVRPGVDPARVEATIEDEIARLANEPVSDEELAKVKTAARRDFYSQITTARMRAIVIGIYSVFYDDPNLVNTYLDRVDAVTKDDVRRVARRYLAATSRVVVTTTPKAAASAAPATAK